MTSEHTSDGRPCVRTRYTYDIVHIDTLTSLYNLRRIPSCQPEPTLLHSLKQLDLLKYRETRAGKAKFKPRPIPDGRRGGGVLIFIRANLACRCLETREDGHFEVLLILTRQPKMPREISHILIGVVYQTPGNENWALSQYLIRCLDRVVKLHPAVKVILTGDFNQFQDSQITSFPLKQVVKSAT